MKKSYFLDPQHMQKETGSWTCQAQVTSCFPPQHDTIAGDTHVTRQLVGPFGYLIGRCDHSRKTAFASLLFIVLVVDHLESENKL